MMLAWAKGKGGKGKWQEDATGEKVAAPLPAPNVEEPASRVVPAPSVEPGGGLDAAPLADSLPSTVAASPDATQKVGVAETVESSAPLTQTLKETDPVPKTPPRPESFQDAQPRSPPPLSQSSQPVSVAVGGSDMKVSVPDVPGSSAGDVPDRSSLEPTVLSVALNTKEIFEEDFPWEQLGKKLMWKRCELIKNDECFPEFASLFDYSLDGDTSKPVFGGVLNRAEDLTMWNEYLIEKARQAEEGQIGATLGVWMNAYLSECVTR